MPSLLQNLCIGQYQPTMLVLSRLSAACTPMTGANDQARTFCFASVDAQPQYDDGTEYGRRSSDGLRCWYVRDCNHFKQIDLTIAIITWDMELIELSTGSTLLVGKTGTPWVGKSMGFGIPGGDDACPSGVATEVYTKAAYGTGGFCVSTASGAPVYVRHLFPFARLQMGQVTLDDNSDGIMLNLTGFGMANPNWGNGPKDDWPANTDVATSSPYAAVFTSTLPDATCGYVAPTAA